MNQQQIHDRLGELNREVNEAKEKAGTLKAMSQKAERSDLRAACGAQGHVFTAGFYGLFSIVRCCAVCGAAEDQPAQDVARRFLSTGS